MTETTEADASRFRRVLMVANQTCPCPALLDLVSSVATPELGEVLIVAPALSSRLRHWASDVDDSIEGAQRRLAEAAAGLSERGITASGEVGDSEPMHAIGDALARFEAEAVVIGTYPPDDSHWLEKGLIESARERFSVPILHVESRYGLAG